MFLVVIDVIALVVVVAYVAYLLKLDPWILAATLGAFAGGYGIYLVYKTLLSRMIIF